MGHHYDNSQFPDRLRVRDVDLAPSQHLPVALVIVALVPDLVESGPAAFARLTAKAAGILGASGVHSG